MEAGARCRAASHRASSTGKLQGKSALLSGGANHRRDIVTPDPAEQAQPTIRTVVCFRRKLLF
jgi:hypothetical protein